MNNRLFRRGAITAVLAGCLTAPLAGCGGGTPSHAAMPQQMVGMDVVVEPRVALSGEGARRNPDFGASVVGAVESKLVGEGFDVVPAGRGSNPLRIQMHANLSVSRSSLIIVNGKPLESEEARVQVRVVTHDGALVDSFSVEGDPSESELAANVAVQLVERMKNSPKLQAMATAAQGSPATVVAEEGPTQRPKVVASDSRGQGKSLVPVAGARGKWPDVSKKVRGQADGQNDAAVIVAIERYAELTAVPGAVANAEDWFEYLTQSRKVPRRSVKMLSNEQARDKQIIAAVEEAATLAKAGGRVWFVFIGHGAPNRNTKGMLVGYDAFQTAEGLEDRSVETDSVLYALRSTRATPVLVLDACFSGRAREGEPLVAGLQPSGVMKNEPVGDALVLTAAQSNEFAGPLPGAERPAFSYLALGALRGWGDQDEDGSVTATEVETYVGDTLRVLLAGKRQQRPSLDGQRPNLVLSKAKEREPKAVQEQIRESGR